MEEPFWIAGISEVSTASEWPIKHPILCPPPFLILGIEPRLSNMPGKQLHKDTFYTIRMCVTNLESSQDTTFIGIEVVLIKFYIICIIGVYIGL